MATLRRQVVWLLVIASWSSLAFAGSTTWHYDSFARTAGDGPQTILLPPAHTPVSVDITFDPNTPPSGSFNNENLFLCTGGDTSLRIQIGTHVSAPVDKFRIVVFQAGDSDINKVLLVGFDTTGVSVDFPGYLERGQFYGEFMAPRTDVHFPNSLPPTKPYPGSLFFEDFTTQNAPAGGDPAAPFVAEFFSVPEPAGFVLSITALSVIILCGRRSGK